MGQPSLFKPPGSKQINATPALASAHAVAPVSTTVGQPETARPDIRSRLLQLGRLIHG